jgi:hypothetical protein
VRGSPSASGAIGRGPTFLLYFFFGKKSRKGKTEIHKKTLKTRLIQKIAIERRPRKYD